MYTNSNIKWILIASLDFKFKLVFSSGQRMKLREKKFMATQDTPALTKDNTKSTSTRKFVIKPPGRASGVRSVL